MEKRDTTLDNENTEENLNDSSNREEKLVNKEIETELDSVSELSNKILEMEEIISGLKESLLREKAEVINVIKRSDKDKEEKIGYANSQFAKDLIEVSENLYLAIDSMKAVGAIEDDRLKNFCDGVIMTSKILTSVFTKHGMHRIYPLGEIFDHNLHQAIGQQDDETKEENTILQVIRAGYTIKDRLLQPALVYVSKKS